MDIHWPVEQLQPFERGYILGLWEAVWTYWCIAAHVGHNVLVSSGLWIIPTPIDQVLDGQIVQKLVKIDALCEQWWPSEQHPGKKSKHILHLLHHQGPLGTVFLQQDSDHILLVWCRDRDYWRVEWHSVVFSDESRFFLYASAGSTHVRHRPCDWYFRVHSPMIHMPYLRLHGVGTISYNCYNAMCSS